MGSFRNWVGNILALWLAANLGCESQNSNRLGVTTPLNADGGLSDADPDRIARFACVDNPNAYVFTAGADPAVAYPALNARLQAAGFVPLPLPLEASPFELKGLIVLPASAAALPAYAAYMAAHAPALYAFVDKANVLLQMPQDAAVEPRPPFLPTTHTAHRGGVTSGALHVKNPESPLLRGLGATMEGLLPWSAMAPSGSAFNDQGGFETVLSSDPAGNVAALIEGAYGQGRIVLSALAFDSVPQHSPYTQAADLFFQNLRQHVLNVCARQVPALKLTASSYQRLFTPGSQFLALIPDTQVYSLINPGLFFAQTAWIASHAAEINIRYVLHLGDIVNNNTPLEWGRAASAMSLLDNVVPYAIVPGNHDYGPSGDASSRQTFMNEFFSFEQTSKLPSFGGAFENGKLDNTFHLLDVGGRSYVLLALEWGPRDSVIAWANEVMQAHPERYGILLTHAYLNNNDRRYDHKDKANPQHFNPHEYATPGVNDGEELWQKLVRRHRFLMTFNGHVLGDGTGYLLSTSDQGTPVHQMLSNYQMRNLGGDGFMRLIEFLPDNQTVRVWSYSPLYDRFLSEADQNFAFVLPSP